MTEDYKYDSTYIHMIKKRASVIKMSANKIMLC